MKRHLLIGLILITITFGLGKNVLASWYAGNTRHDAYGVKANIWTPSSVPYLELSGESNWVSLPSNNWIQAGWRFYKGWSKPKRYIEHVDSNGQYEITYYGTQSWGSIVNYKLDHTTGDSWCAYIANDLKKCKSIRSAPTTVYAMSEVHDSPHNELDTRFSAVYYKTDNDLWFLFNQENWSEDFPYKVQKDQLYYFRTYRGTTHDVSLPIVLNNSE